MKTWAVISEEDAQMINVGLDDDNKTGFTDGKGGFFTYTDTATQWGLTHTVETVTNEVADGTFPLVKKRKMFS